MSPKGSTLHLKIYLDGDTVYLNPSANVLRQREKREERYVVTVETRSVFATVPVGGLNVANYAVVSPNVITQMNAELSAAC